jgi:hypothetical protein
MRTANRIGAQNPLTLGALALLAPLSLTATISAAELPKELIMQCEGTTKLSVTLFGNAPDFQTDTFHFVLRLKDGSLSNVDGNFFEGENCALTEDIIRCESDTTSANRKEHRTAAINRATGEMRLLLESQTLDGTDTKSGPSATIKSLRTGVCHSEKTKSLF